MSVEGIVARTAPGPGVPARADDALVEGSYAHCRRVVSRAGRNFRYAIALTPPDRRGAMDAMYAWMRRADDLVDDAPDDAAARAAIERYARETRDALDGGGPGADHWPAFAHAVRRFAVERAWLERLLDELSRDAAPRVFELERDVDAYCEGVASTVGLVCVAIWGVRPGTPPERVRELAMARGRALQRTNILRDLGRDLAPPRPRVYLSREALSHAGLTPTDLLAWRDPARCRALVLRQCALAAREYEVSAALEALVAPDCVPVLATMTRIYRGVLARLEASPYLSVRGRAAIPAWRKAAIAVREVLRARLAEVRAHGVRS